MIELSTKEIAEAVGGRLIGDGDKIVKTVTTDSRKADSESLFVALKGEKFDGNDYLEDVDGVAGVALTQREAKVSYPIVVTDDSLVAFGRLAEYYSKSKTSLKLTVSLTGSVGKTTTKEMISSVLSTVYKTAYTKGNFNNHIGVPITLLSVEEEHEALVCEMGMNHKGELEYLTSMVDSDIALITNIGHSHIENLGSREGIRDAKLEILGGLKKDGTLIVNGDEPLLEAPPFDGRIIRVGTTASCDLWADNVQMNGDGVSYTLHTAEKEVKIRLSCTGRHNVMNSLFAIAVGQLAGIELDSIQVGLLNYKCVGLRQNIYEKNGVRVIADCYNAGIESMFAALTLMSELECKGRRIAVLADMLELGNMSDSAHESVGEKAADCKTDMVLTTGNAARLISRKASSKGTFTQHFDTKEELAAYLKENMQEGDTVLFKASHSMKLEDVISLADLEK